MRCSSTMRCTASRVGSITLAPSVASISRADILQPASVLITTVTSLPPANPSAVACTKPAYAALPPVRQRQRQAVPAADRSEYGLVTYCDKRTARLTNRSQRLDRIAALTLMLSARVDASTGAASAPRAKPGPIALLVD